MGTYDSVLVPCPKCGVASEFQSKGGDCFLREYTLENAPADVLSDVNRHAPNTCEKCGTRFAVNVPGAAGKGMAILADSLHSQIPGTVPLIFDVGPSARMCALDCTEGLMP